MVGITHPGGRADHLHVAAEYFSNEELAARAGHYRVGVGHSPNHSLLDLDITANHVVREDVLAEEGHVGGQVEHHDARGVEGDVDDVVLDAQAVGIVLLDGCVHCCERQIQ